MSLVENLLTFGRLLKRAGIDTHAGRTTDVVDADDELIGRWDALVVLRELVDAGIHPGLKDRFRPRILRFRKVEQVRH